MNGSPTWPRRIARSIRRRLHGGLGPRWVVAVSGGSDSVAMLCALHAIAPDVGLVLSVAHLDHGAREESTADAQFVAELAGSLGLPFDLGQWQPSRSAHFEADARRARYAWLLETATARNASVIATAHSRDDQAETILHRLLRGTGPRGLAGMPRSRRLGDGVTLFRPLLDVGRDDLRSYLLDIGQPWRDDPTNLDTSRTRARIRHDLLPRLANEFNPHVAAAILRLGDLTREAMATVDGVVAELANKTILSKDQNDITINQSRLAECSPYLRAEFLRALWRSAGWPEAAMDHARWRRLAAWIMRSEGALDIGAGVRAVIADGTIVLSRSVTTEPTLSAPIPLDLPGTATWTGGRVVATIDPDGLDGERLDLDRLVPPLTVDHPRPGDRFDPLGLDGHSMPLADFLRGRHVPKADRERLAVVRDTVGIVWVVGHRIGHRARLTEETRRVVGLRWEGETGQ